MGVALPAVASFVSRLGIVAVFLAAFSIPVASTPCWPSPGRLDLQQPVVHPRRRRVYQALNVVVLESTTSTANATAYSAAQQLIVSAWVVLFAIVLVAWVFGWSGGRELVRQSYADAEVKERELKQKRQARRAARRRDRRIKP